MRNHSFKTSRALIVLLVISVYYFDSLVGARLNQTSFFLRNIATLDSRRGIGIGTSISDANAAIRLGCSARSLSYKFMALESLSIIQNLLPTSLANGYAFS